MPPRQRHQRTGAIPLLPEMPGSREGKSRRLKQSQRQREAQAQPQPGSPGHIHTHTRVRMSQERTMQRWCACSDPPGRGLSTRPHALPQMGVQSRSVSVWQTGHLLLGHGGGRTGIPSARARAGDAEASAQGLIYQRDRSRCQSLPQKSAGLKMQRTETLRHSCLSWPPSGKPNRAPCTLSSTLAPGKGQARGCPERHSPRGGRGEPGRRGENPN